LTRNAAREHRARPQRRIRGLSSGELPRRLRWREGRAVDAAIPAVCL